ncbi:MAG: KAP family P-loop NTPase fold protein [Candidatus Paracaedibacter sp.]
MEDQEKSKQEEKILTEVFEHDLLSRKDLMIKLNNKIEVLSHVGGTIAIHSPFGNGKTWLCDRWIEYLSKAKKDELIATKIDAFICDYVQDPFEVIHRRFDKILEDGDKQLLTKLKAKAISIGKAAFPYALKTFLSFLIGVPSIGEKLGEILSNEISKEDDDSLEEIVKQYKDSLKGIIEKKQKKIVIFVDELDRCSPKFAINFLEKIKHYFDVEGVAFVLMINKDQFYKSINGFYGQDIDPAAYLEKFLSLPVIDLPSQHLSSYYQSPRVKDRPSYKFYKKLISEKYQSLKAVGDCFIEYLSELSEQFNLNYREHEQALLLASLCPEGYNSVDDLDSYFLVMQIKHPSILSGIYEGQLWAHKQALKNLQETEKKIKEYGIQPDARQVMSLDSTRGLMSLCQAFHLNHINNVEEHGSINVDDHQRWSYRSRIEPLI